MVFITSNSCTIIIFIIIIAVADCMAEEDDGYYYRLCGAFECGGINFSFPFSNSTMFGTGPRDCGLPRFQIICNADSPKIELGGRLYHVNGFFPAERAITLVDTQLVTDLTTGGSCNSLVQNFTIDVMSSPIASLSLPSWNFNNFSFFICPQSQTLLLSSQFLHAAVINRSCGDSDDELYMFSNRTDLNPVETPESCRRVEVPVSDAISSASLWNHRNKSERWDLLLQALGDGFPLTWSDIPACTSCQNTGGRCGYDDSASVTTVCFFKDAILNREDKSKKRGVVIGRTSVYYIGIVACIFLFNLLLTQQLFVGIASGCSFIASMVALFILVNRKRVQQLRSNKDQPTKIDATSFVKTYQSTMMRSYTYKEIKKMTDFFKEKLGEGGYGSVYKGQLSDGRLVAVKVLDKSNHETQDFINEVSTIGRIHHFHIIYLLGFCMEGSKQALVYEFMPNGSLGDMLQRNEFSSLGIEKMLEISIGIAQGIQYLHSGCESRILHLDIKPQNILMDQNMSPKISDFGLAKMYARNKSAATVTTGARGTIGYIAPEMFMRNIGNPSDRSDVYSFGMLLLEMVGETKRNGDAEWNDSKSSEKYFPGWVYDKLIDEAAGGLSTTNTTEQEVEELEVSLLRKMVMVGLWCIQMNPKVRPSMTKVVEMLNGDVETIEMPPKPLFYSPPPPPLQIMDTQNLVTSSTESDSTDSLPLRTETR